ncbi:ester cyclase [Bradyrhizobium sp. UFLA05-112]
MTANTTRRAFVTAITGAAIGSATGATMATAQGAAQSTNVRLFIAIIERGFNQGDLSIADEVCAPKLSEHEYLAKTDVLGPEILKDQIQTARGNIQGLTLTVEDLVESGDKVWGRSTATGTHRRSGKPISMTVIDICRFENGRLVEHWGVPDRFAMLHQAGALPPPKQ